MQATLSKNNFFLIIVLFIHASLLGQAPIIKKITEINFHYRYGNTMSIDTIVELYSKDGKEIRDKQKESCGIINIRYIKTITIDSTKQKIVRKQLHSDSSATDQIEYFYKDSTIFLLLNGTDTIYWSKNFLKHNKTFYRIEKSTDELYATSVVKINFLRKKSTKTSVNENGTKQIVKFYKNRIFNIKKEMNYNSEKQEWFTIKKERLNKKGEPLKQVVKFYHDYFKIYFKTFTKYKYNTWGQLQLKAVKDHYRTIESKTIYLYEYY